MGTKACHGASQRARRHTSAPCGLTWRQGRLIMEVDRADGGALISEDRWLVVVAYSTVPMAPLAGLKVLLLLSFLLLN
ncbi:hypothetical protein OSB04_013822 [Centaurea solstitialis]|uniref:Uncharacterized protein n=1 Tax=Centaurea solstitialis TaxID=347529 RepID=A0AA38TYQ0_9ASTR|nr:hypothetical protein OSB04_013822 [Centaurea solstitialis]